MNGICLYFVEKEDILRWTIPVALKPKRCSSFLWLKPVNEDPHRFPLMNTFDNSYIGFYGYDINAPKFSVEINLSVKSSLVVQLELINLSSEDSLLFWIITDNGIKLGPNSIPMQTYSKKTQSCKRIVELNNPINITHIEFQFPKGQAGDVFIECVRFIEAKNYPIATRPVVFSKNLPDIYVDAEINCQSLRDAFDLLRNALVYQNLPVNGFRFPFIRPGENGEVYGDNWWLLDLSLMIPACCISDPDFAMNIVIEFARMTCTSVDGCIPHEGKIVRTIIPSNLSVLPRVFEAWFYMAELTADISKQYTILYSMNRYLNWWFQFKRDTKTGLITSYFEESFTCGFDVHANEMAACDTNAAVYVGANLTAKLAAQLSKYDIELQAIDKANMLKESIQKYLYSYDDKTFYNYMVKSGAHRKIAASNMFDMLRMDIATETQKLDLIKKLTNDETFGFGSLGLTSISKKDPHFTVVKGEYTNLSWDGGIWTMKNMMIIKGLEESGFYEEAAVLVLQTLNEFNENWGEFLDPVEGNSQGIKRYSWSTAQWIELLFEHLFGIHWNSWRQELSIYPFISRKLQGKTITLKNYHVPYLETTLDMQLCRESNEITIVLKLHNCSGLYVKTMNDNQQWIDKDRKIAKNCIISCISDFTRATNQVDQN